MTTIDAERVKELGRIIDRQFLEYLPFGCTIYLSKQSKTDLLAILDDYSALKEENERLTKLLSEYQKSGLREGGLFLHAGQIAADLATDRCRLIADNNCLKAELAVAQMTNAKNGAVIIEQMVQLARQAPLIEAAQSVMVNLCDLMNPGLDRPRPELETMHNKLAAALALREKKGEKE